ncbi:MAG: helix-turn-helix domain-containing protein [Acetobacteraceae bacterium]
MSGREARDGATHDFADAELFCEAFRARSATTVILEKGAFRGSATRAQLGMSWAQRGFGNLRRTSHAVITDRSHFAFVARPGADQSWNGRALRQNQLLCLSGEVETFIRSDGLAGWASLSFSHEDHARLGALLSGPGGAGAQRPVRLDQVDPRAFHRLQACHAAMERMTRDRPHLLAVPAIARMIDDGLIRALAACVDGTAPDADRAASRRHHRIVSRMVRFLADVGDDPVTLTELSVAVGTSLRTLNLCSNEILGVSPVRFLTLRRLRLARRDLRLAAQRCETVTTVAMRYGFVDLSRFAANYLRTFGERPSDTLRRGT